MFGQQQQAGGFGYQQQSYAAAHASVEERSAFIMRTYVHLVGAIMVFVALEAGLVLSGLAARIAEMALGYGQVGWLVFLGLFMVVSYIADRWARSGASMGMQYAGLALYTFAEAIIFAPLILLAMAVAVEDGGGAMDILGQAGLITVVLFAGLTGIVFITRKDFSFLRSILMFGGMAALALIVAGAIFGFTLGLAFMWFMVLFAAGSILYNTSNVLHYYRTDQHVAAALNLFASFALLLWYVIQIVMSSRD